MSLNFQRIAGVIIAKQDPRSFQDKRNPSQKRWQLSFTLRDSIVDFINVSCWGGELFINDISKSFKIGDAIEIRNYLVQTKQNTEAEGKYNPWTPSDFNVVANEPHASVVHYNGSDVNTLATAALVPVKECNDYYKLGDIIANGHNLNSLHANVLAAIRHVGCRREMVTKFGKTIQRREIQIFDETCSSFPLTIWDNELNEMADAWTKWETVLFLADIKLHFDEYRKCMVATCDGKTIISVNPDIPDAHMLYGFVQNAHLAENEQFQDDQQNYEISLENIQEMFTVESLQNWIDVDTDQCVLYGIIAGGITHFNIDSPNDGDKIHIQRCSGCCKYSIDPQLLTCSNTSCSNQHQTQNSTSKQIDLRIDISDVTGGMPNFRLKGSIAEKTIGCTVDELLNANLNVRTELKWNFLMNRYRVYFKCSRHKENKKRTFLDVLSIQPIET